MKISLVLEIKKLGPAFLTLNLSEFPFFDGFFLKLSDFWDLNNFWAFNFFDFLINSSLLMLLISPPSNNLGDSVAYSIEISDITILESLK